MTKPKNQEDTMKNTTLLQSYDVEQLYVGIDVHKLSTQLAAGRLRGIQGPTVEQEQRRMLSRTREQLVEHRAALKNQIRMKAHQLG
jgi:hypothetical protein